MTAAQPVEISALEHCASLATPELKLGCFEAIIADSKTTEMQPSSAAESSAGFETAASAAAVSTEDARVDARNEGAGETVAAVVEPTAASPSVQAGTAASAAAVSTVDANAVTRNGEAGETVATVVDPSTASPSIQAGSAASAAPDSAVDVKADSPAVAASQPMATVAETVSPEPVRTDSAEVLVAATATEGEFGQDHLEKTEQHKAEDDADLRTTVVDVSKGRNDILYFHLDNGQVWRQNESRHYPYPKNVEFDVTISRGMMGDYRMRIGDNSRMVRIRRIK